MDDKREKQFFVGIDPSYTGFAMVRAGLGGKDVVARGIKAEKKHWPSRPARLDFIRVGMLDFLAETRPALIAIEGYAYGAKQNREMMGELGGVVRLALWSEGYSFIDVQPGTLKSYITGKGNAPKSEMMRDVFRKWGYVAKDDDDADAYALCRLAIEFSTAGSRTKVFEKLVKKIEEVVPTAPPARKKKKVMGAP